MSDVLNCSLCGSKVCICEFEDNNWAAHCMNCDNSIGKPGFYDPCAKSKKEATERWNELNKKPYQS